MPHHARPVLHLLMITAALVTAGCQSAAPNEHALTLASFAPPTTYQSDMAFTIDLTDPMTGLPRPATMDELQPILLREAARITYEPTLRQILNKPAVQQTQWFAQFKDNLDQAFEDLRERITVIPIPDTPVLRVYATAEDPEDAQIILRVLSDEYLRQKELSIAASHQRRLRAAHKSRDRAEQTIDIARVQLKRFLELHLPDAEGVDPEQARYLELEMASLIRELQRAEARQAKAIERIEMLMQNEYGFSNFVVSQEYHPQKAIRIQAK